MSLRGIIFDMDGTLVDSGLDFDAIRRDIGLPERHPILEGVEAIPAGPERERALEILHRHEHEGAVRALLEAGADKDYATPNGLTPLRAAEVEEHLKSLIVPEPEEEKRPKPYYDPKLASDAKAYADQSRIQTREQAKTHGFINFEAWASPKIICRTCPAGRPDSP